MTPGSTSTEHEETNAAESLYLPFCTPMAERPAATVAAIGEQLGGDGGAGVYRKKTYGLDLFRDYAN